MRTTLNYVIWFWLPLKFTCCTNRGSSLYLTATSFSVTANVFSALTLLVGHQEEHPACKHCVVRFWSSYLSGARCKWSVGNSHCRPIISCFIKIQNGSAFSVPAYQCCPLIDRSSSSSSSSSYSSRSHYRCDWSARQKSSADLLVARSADDRRPAIPFQLTNVCINHCSVRIDSLCRWVGMMASLPWTVVIATALIYKVRHKTCIHYVSESDSQLHWTCVFPTLCLSHLWHLEALLRCSNTVVCVTQKAFDLLKSTTFPQEFTSRTVGGRKPMGELAAPPQFRL